MNVQITSGLMPATIYVEINGVPLTPVTATSVWQFGNLCPGDQVNVLIIDFAGDTCLADTTFQIQSLPSPDAQVTITNASCSSCNDGAATPNVTGGSAPYSYLWSDGSTAPALHSLLPGIYILYVTDANGCMDIDTVVIGVGVNGYFGLFGQVYLDLNTNGVKDAGEVGIGNHELELTPEILQHCRILPWESMVLLSLQELLMLPISQHRVGF
jgi:hypothetical protein